MTAEEWAEVFQAGAAVISGIGMLREEGLSGDLYGAAAVKRALEAMAQKAAEIAARTGDTPATAEQPDPGSGAA